jgi:hypothetical protein
LNLQAIGPCAALVPAIIRRLANPFAAGAQAVGAGIAAPGEFVNQLRGSWRESADECPFRA